MLKSYQQFLSEAKYMLDKEDVSLEDLKETLGEFIEASEDEVESLKDRLDDAQHQLDLPFDFD